MAVLKEMNFYKTSVEFYSLFWMVIGDVVVDTSNESFCEGELSHSQKQAVTTLIHKEGKVLLQIKNYTPISFLNVDYKILNKVLSTRI